MTQINVGVVGLGRGFILTLPALKAHSAVRLAGAFDLRAEALSHFQTEFGAPSHNSLGSLLADPAIDAVYIATPHEFHAAQAIAALRAGKHVLVEKPMAVGVAECAAMARAASEAGRHLIIGPSHGFDEPVHQAANLVASGRFGAVRMVTAFNFTDFMYRPRRPEELDPARGGGVVYSQAAHQIDVVRRIVGQPVSMIRAVTGNWDADRPSDGAYTALFGFAGGAAATLTYSGYAHYDSDELLGWISELGQVKDPSRHGAARKALAGMTRDDEEHAKLARTYGAAGFLPSVTPTHHEHFGFVLISCERGDLKLLPTGIEIYSAEEREFLSIPPPTLPRANVIDEFIAAIEGVRQPVHDGHWGLETVACCAALIESSLTSADIDPRELINRNLETI